MKLIIVNYKVVLIKCKKEKSLTSVQLFETVARNVRWKRIEFKCLLSFNLFVYFEKRALKHYMHFKKFPLKFNMEDSVK